LSYNINVYEKDIVSVIKWVSVKL